MPGYCQLLYPLVFVARAGALVRMPVDIDASVEHIRRIVANGHQRSRTDHRHCVNASACLINIPITSNPLCSAPTIQTLHPPFVHEIRIGQQRPRPQRDHILRVQIAPAATVVPAVRDALAVETLLASTLGGALALGQAIVRDVRVAEATARIRFERALVGLARSLRALVLDVLLVAGGHTKGVRLRGFVSGAERTGAQLAGGVGQHTGIGAGRAWSK